MSRDLCDTLSENHSHYPSELYGAADPTCGRRWGKAPQEEQSHLLPVLMLQVQPGLDVAASLLKGLSLRHLSRVVCADANDVGAEEQQHVGTELQEGTGAW